MEAKEVPLRFHRLVTLHRLTLAAVLPQILVRGGLQNERDFQRVRRGESISVRTPRLGNHVPPVASAAARGKIQLRWVQGLIASLSSQPEIGHAGDLRDETPVDHLGLNVGDVQPRERQAEPGREFTGDGLDSDDQLWVERPGGCPPAGALRGLATVPESSLDGPRLPQRGALQDRDLLPLRRPWSLPRSPRNSPDEPHIVTQCSAHLCPPAALCFDTGLINSDKPHLWKADIAASVDQYNEWFVEFAPLTYRETRAKTTETVRNGLLTLNDLLKLDAEFLTRNPGLLQILRMATAPPLARDRLVGLAYTTKPVVERLEKRQLPSGMSRAALMEHLERICAVIEKLLDRDLFPWVEDKRTPSEVERQRASTIVADRLCGALSDPIVRNAQEQRQLKVIEDFLVRLEYKKKPLPAGGSLKDMEPGTFTFRLGVLVGSTDYRVNIPIDAVIQRKRVRANRMPILIEAKSAGDFTNPNKRRKEEATKIAQLKKAHGTDIEYILFLCGYFDAGYLGYEAAEGLDWVWEHRTDDLLQVGLS